MIEIRSFRATCCLFKSAKACISAMELKSKFPPLTMTPIFSELILSLYANNDLRLMTLFSLKGISYLKQSDFLIHNISHQQSL